MHGAWHQQNLHSLKLRRRKQDCCHNMPEQNSTPKLVQSTEHAGAPLSPQNNSASPEIQEQKPRRSCQGCHAAILHAALKHVRQLSIMAPTPIMQVHCCLKLPSSVTPLGRVMFAQGGFCNLQQGSDSGVVKFATL